MSEGITVVLGSGPEKDGTFGVELRATGFERAVDAEALVRGLRAALRTFSQAYGEVKMDRCKAGSADEAIAVFHSRDATKQ